MKKIMLFVLLGLIMAACGKDDEPSTYTAFANVTYDGASASPSIVCLFDHDIAKDFDKSKEAAVKFANTRHLYTASGAEIRPSYTSDTYTGVNTFTDIAKGRYIAVAMYKPSGYSYPMFYFYGYTELNLDYNAKMVSFKFTSSSPRGEFVKF